MSRSHLDHLVAPFTLIHSRFCIYCGNPRQCKDHLLLYWAAAHLGQEQTLQEPWTTLRLLLPACHECNFSASHLVFMSFEDKAIYVKRRLWTHFSTPRKQTPPWTPLPNDPDLQQVTTRLLYVPPVKLPLSLTVLGCGSVPRRAGNTTTPKGPRGHGLSLKTLSPNTYKQVQHWWADKTRGQFNRDLFASGN